MPLFKQIPYLSILATTIPVQLSCISEEIKNGIIGAACIICPAIAEGQQAKGEVKGLRQQNQTLQDHNQTLQSSLEAATVQASTLTNNLAAAHIAKQQAEAAAALAVHRERAKRDEIVRQLSKTEAVAVGLGVALTVGVVAVIGYGIYYGVSCYMHNNAKTAAHQQLKACIEGDGASLAKSQNCEKEFHEFARYAQGEELLLEQQRLTGRTRTS